MSNVRQQALCVSLLMLAGSAAIAQSSDWAGYVSFEPRWFFEQPQFDHQPDRGLSASAVLAPELRATWNGGDDRVTISPFLRFDADDDHRNHGDVREALWMHVRGPWTWRIGLGRVFWGVAESRHLVDIVNQTDLVEDIDEEDKLGQPMVSMERWTDGAGTFALYVLPGFRERTFAAPDARLRGYLPIAVDEAEYASDDEDRRIDTALRWSQVLGAWDMGVAVFHGTSREPRLVPTADAAGGIVLVPHYDLIDQLGLDLQYTRGAWLWKFESIERAGYGERFAALVTGFEYTRYGILGSSADLGLLLEYLYDDRSASAPLTVYDDDVFLGFRLSLNDVDDTALLAGLVVDNSATLAFLEAERRIGSHWRVQLEGRFFIGVDATDALLAGVRDDGFVSLGIARYF